MVQITGDMLVSGSVTNVLVILCVVLCLLIVFFLELFADECVHTLFLDVYACHDE